MLYLLALLLPPIALLLTGRPLSALINAALWLGGLLTFGLTSFLAILHACIVVSSSRADARHRALLSAVTGKTPPKKPKAETTLLFSTLALVAVALAIAALRQDLSPPSAIQNPQSAPLPAVGTSFATVTALHGPPTAKDPATGWAHWPAFRARFQGGVVMDAAAP